MGGLSAEELFELFFGLPRNVTLYRTANGGVYRAPSFGRAGVYQRRWRGHDDTAPGESAAGGGASQAGLAQLLPLLFVFVALLIAGYSAAPDEPLYSLQARSGYKERSTPALHVTYYVHPSLLDERRARSVALQRGTEGAVRRARRPCSRTGHLRGAGRTRSMSAVDWRTLDARVEDEHIRVLRGRCADEMRQEQRLFLTQEQREAAAEKPSCARLYRAQEALSRHRAQ